MHPALRIPELLSEIFQYLADDWGRPCAALAGALTCKAFLSPALDALWNELPDIRPIIKLIPGIKTRFAYPHHLFLLDADDVQETVRASIFNSELKLIG
ncbi:hypothetical protein BJ165DRAFT_394038 [Panaeolus papilionaceus]|nr:hypothetical protein BJ165DRAFT_394038 [Panaeolus papilionaceus]